MKKTTIYDIARICGVSPRTVTRAFQDGSYIKDERRKNILEAAEQHHYKPNDAAGRLAQKPVRLVGILVHVLDTFSEGIISGLKESHRKLVDYKVELEIRSVSTPEEILKCCEELQNGDFDGVITMAMDPPAELTETLNALGEAGIPTVTILNHIPQLSALSDIRCDYAASARLACELLQVYAGNGPVVLFTGSQKTFIHDTIHRSFMEDAQKRKITISHVYDTEDSPEEARLQAEEMLTRYPETKGIYIASANSAAILDVLEERGAVKNIKVIASDLYPRLSKALKQGTVNATIVQNEFGQAKTAMLMLYAYLTGKKELPPAVLNGPQVVFASNLSYYLKKDSTDKG